MSFPPPDEINLFEAPRAEIGARPMDFGMDADAELIRRAHIGHEASVKSIGSLFFLGAFFAAVGGIVMILGAVGVLPLSGLDAENGRIIFGATGGVMLLLFALYFALGYGLSRLQVWARWTVVVLDGLWLLSTTANVIFAVASINPVLGLVSGIIPYLIAGYIMYLLVSAKGGVVFSPAYKEVIARTPHVKYRTSLIVKIFLVLILGLFVLGIVSAIMSSR